MSNTLTLITGDINATRDEFMTLLADRNIKFEQEAGFAIQVLGNNSYALGVAANNRNSVVNALKNIASIGISLNPAKKQAYLVPRGGAICLDISYMGLLDLAISSGSIMWGQADVVRAGDYFKLNGLDKLPTHEFEPFSSERGEIVGVYVVVKTHSGDYLTTTMPIAEVYDIRNRSESWKSFVAKKAKSSPWDSDPGEMIKKTVIKRAYKLWPKTDRLDNAIHHLNTDGGEGLQDINERPAGLDPSLLIAAALKTTTDADALQFWRDNNASLIADPAAHKKLKDAIAGHRARMAEAVKQPDVIDQNMTEVPRGSEQGGERVLTPEELDAQRGEGQP